MKHACTVYALWLSLVLNVSMSTETQLWSSTNSTRTETRPTKKMDAYCKSIRKLEGRFYGIEYIHVVWDKNQAADALSKLGST